VPRQVLRRALTTMTALAIAGAVIVGAVLDARFTIHPDTLRPLSAYHQEAHP
jgi:uncharacterized membrane protein YdcZ (DUF606 family)